MSSASLTEKTLYSSLYSKLIKAILLLQVIWCVFVSWKLVELAGSDLVLRFPFMWPDSFDWVSNGLYYLDKFIYGMEGINTPTIRQPFFTLLLGALELNNALWIAPLLCQGAYLATFFLIYKTSNYLRLNDFFTASILSLIFFSSNINYFRYFIMSDPFCILFLTSSLYFYLRSFNGDKFIFRYFAFGVFFSSLGLITQFFGVIPSLIYTSLLLVYGIIQRRALLVIIAICNLLGTASLECIWRVFKKFHYGSFGATQVSHFELLSLKFDNFDFYLNVWGVYYLPILTTSIAILSLAFVRKVPINIKQIISFDLLLLSGTSLLFTVLVFFYQWQEARFSTFFFHIICLTVFLLLQRAWPTIRINESIVTVIIGIVSFFAAVYLSINPSGDIMRPKFSEFTKNLLTPSFSTLKEISFAKLIEIDINHEQKKNTEARINCLSHNQDGTWSRKEECDAYIYNNIANYLNHRLRLGLKY